jgi:phospholipase D1/2
LIFCVFHQNDRSFLGDRDSELGVLIDDEDLVASHLNGKPVWVGRFPQRLRLSLWAEHLGLSLQDESEWKQIEDAVCDEVYKVLYCRVFDHFHSTNYHLVIYAIFN